MHTRVRIYPLLVPERHRSALGTTTEPLIRHGRTAVPGRRDQATPPVSARRVGADLREGFREFAGRQWLWVMVVSAAFLNSGSRLGDGAVLIQSDAADFTLDEAFPFAVSTYDIPNHLGGMERIRGYLECVHRAVRPGGWFVFDVATRKGLLGINSIQARETDTSILLYRVP